MKHSNKYLADMGHKNWKVGDSFIDLDSNKWIVCNIQTVNDHLENGYYATCFSGDLVGSIKHLSNIIVRS